MKGKEGYITCTVRCIIHTYQLCGEMLLLIIICEQKNVKFRFKKGP